MAYNFYLDKILLPVPPVKFSIKINNKNKTMTLINDEEINILKSAGLLEVNFDFLLPQTKYPFATYKNNSFKNAEYFLKKINKLKTNGKPFRFMVVREMPNGAGIYDTNIKVSLEDYTINEDADNGFDVSISIKLKQYKEYSTKTITIIEPVAAKVVTTTVAAIGTTKIVAQPVAERAVEYIPPQTCTVVEGDCLWNICKQYLGDGNRCWDIATLNGISNPNLIYPGQVITLG